MIARKGTEIPHEEVTSTMASGKRIRATYGSTTTVRCTKVLSYVVLTSGSTNEGTK